MANINPSSRVLKIGELLPPLQKRTYSRYRESPTQTQIIDDQLYEIGQIERG